MVLFFKILEVGKAIPKSKQTDVLVSMGRHHRLFEEGRIVSHVGVLPIPALELACMQPVGIMMLRPQQIQDQVHRVCMWVALLIFVHVYERQQVLKG